MIRDPRIAVTRDAHDRPTLHIDYDISFYDPDGEFGGSFTFDPFLVESCHLPAREVLEIAVTGHLRRLTGQWASLVEFPFPRDVSADVERSVDLLMEYFE